ncbi:MAG: hypothetical protein H7833_21455, partial [Magnetococcus sp. DMHC-1]
MEEELNFSDEDLGGMGNGAEGHIPSPLGSSLNWQDLAGDGGGVESKPEEDKGGIPPNLELLMDV